MQGKCIAILVALLALAVALAQGMAAPQPQAVSQVSVEVFFDQCREGWIRYKDYCYEYKEQQQYWYVAEQQCRRRDGHLVSIADEAENSFVAKLSYCENAWTGKYAVNVDRLHQPDNYRWTDNSVSPNGYHTHDFSSISSIHQPLISVHNLSLVNNVYHAKQRYICKAKYQDNGGGQNRTCDPGWKLVGNFCYLMPKIEVTFIEATFYCSGRGASMVSIYTKQELRALSLLDLDSRGCPVQTWVGLIKVNPCRIDFSTGEKICYKWADRLVDFHNDFPAWHPGYPDTGDKVNCVLLQDRAMKTVECHERHRFICKKQARQNS
ncbi:hypothetical protein BOX15_Mlig017915g1 [Macrostomum lignano]|uniref:C-type lectin domain-containing protein n=1 Tax=Macrostomum lignano TaxID=282301 RepID=A0A267F416_9PLAT|nr:hypothetical protein BOX15_Mlig017915g1 [Macrostomum lignano]